MKHKNLLFFAALCCALMSAWVPAQAQQAGKDFWVTFLQADQSTSDSGDLGNYNSLVLTLFISSLEDADVLISNPYTGYHEVVSVKGNEVKSVELYNGHPLCEYARSEMMASGKVCYAVNSEQVDTCALHIVSEKSISVVAANYKKATFDVTGVMPTAALGSEYYIQTYTPSDHSGERVTQGSHFAVIATEDNTIIDYCPTVDTKAIHDAKDMYNMTGGVGMTEEEMQLAYFTRGDTLHSPVLMRGQVYYVWTGKADREIGDLSGTYVRSRNGKRIAVFQGCPHTNIPYQIKQRDHLFSQAMPVQYWGDSFALTASSGRPVDIVRIMALEDGTEIFINGEPVHTFDFSLNPKRYWEFEIGANGAYGKDSSCLVTASAPCAVHLFMVSQRYRVDKNSSGDPAMLWISPLSQQISQTIFPICDSKNGTSNHFVNVVTQTPQNMLLNGKSIADSFKPLSGTSDESYGQQYYYAQIALGSTAPSDEFGSITAPQVLKNTDGSFIAHAYGYSSNESYAYSLDNYAATLFSLIGIPSEYGNIAAEYDVRNHTYTCTAIPYSGCHFVKWADGVTDNPRVIRLTQDMTLEAIFAPNPRITFVYDRHKGTVGGSYTTPTGVAADYVTFYAQPLKNCRFVKWGDGVTKRERTIYLDRDTTMEAIFDYARSGRCGDDYALYWNYDNSDKSLTISGNGSLNSNYSFGVEAPYEAEKLIIAEGVTSIGNSAFYGYSKLKHLSVAASVKTIYEQAFYNCTGLQEIYSYREKPSTAYSNTFDGMDKFECTLHVLSESVDMYKAATGWRDFYYIQTIDATEVTETMDDVTVTPSENEATVTWPTSGSADSYTIVITKDGVVFCTLIFNANGQLIGIAFAPSRDGNHAPAAVMTANGGMRFTVTGLDAGTHYNLEVIAKDAGNETLVSYQTSFTTTGAPATALKQITNDKCQMTNKLLRNGQLYLMYKGKMYNVQGAEVR